MAGLELRICEHTVPGVFPSTSSFTWLYIDFVLSSFDCNVFSLLGFFSGAIQSLFWFVLKSFLIKFENIAGRSHEKSISYSYKYSGHNGESAFSMSHLWSFPVACALCMMP